MGGTNSVNVFFGNRDVHFVPYIDPDLFINLFVCMYYGFLLSHVAAVQSQLFTLNQNDVVKLDKIFFPFCLCVFSHSSLFISTDGGLLVSLKKAF